MKKLINFGDFEQEARVEDILYWNQKEKYGCSLEKFWWRSSWGYEWRTKIEAATWLSTQLILLTIVHYYVDFVSIDILNFVVNYHLIKIEQEQYHLTHLNDTKITSKPYLQEKTHPIVKIMGLVAKKRKPPILENPCKDLKIFAKELKSRLVQVKSGLETPSRGFRGRHDCHQRCNYSRPTWYPWLRWKNTPLRYSRGHKKPYRRLRRANDMSCTHTKPWIARGPISKEVLICTKTFSLSNERDPKNFLTYDYMWRI